MSSNLCYNKCLSLFGYSNEKQPQLDSNFLQNYTKIMIEDSERCTICRDANSIGEEEVYFIFIDETRKSIKIFHLYYYPYLSKRINYSRGTNYSIFKYSWLNDTNNLE